MNIDYLVKNANQIGAFFEVETVREIAERDIAGHLKRFWDPRMRSQIVNHVENEGGYGLTPILVSAIKAHRESLCGSPKPIRDEPRWAGPPGGGDAG